MLDKGVLKIMPIEKSTPPEAEAVAARLYAMLPLPRIRITDLLSEVARWTLFTDCFTHLRTGETPGNVVIPRSSISRHLFSREPCVECRIAMQEYHPYLRGHSQ